MANANAPSDEEDDIVLTLQCPRGELLRGEDEDDLVEKVNRHLADVHPDLAGKYTREDILSMAS